MHYGRYLRDADNDRLSPLYLGYETLVRGYTAGSLTNAELYGTNGAAEYDRLLGSRLAVMNLELRFPLFGTTDYGLVDFGYLPTELVAFFDGGVAWYANEAPTLKWATNSADRIPIFSAGIAARVNILGAIVGQVYMAFPFQRPQKTTQFGFVIAPGW
jgi:outer membrane protein assembly factor BamA